MNEQLTAPIGEVPRPGPEAGLYVHVPFCRSKCPYCDFFSVPSAALVPDWIRALEKEARMVASGFGLFDTLYLGGGTPTVLEDGPLRRVMDCLCRLPLTATPEITVEANPNDATPARLKLLAELGANRLSLGVQSLQDAELRLLGRTHTAGDALRAMAAIRSGGHWNLGVDLLFALPGQTEREWVETLTAVLEFAPEHVSCYQLTVKEDTPMGEAVKSGRLVLPGEEVQRGLLCTASRFLEAHGYVHYEVSNYARRTDLARRGPTRRHAGPEPPIACESPGREPPVFDRDFAVCRHNLKYWDRSPYLGLGPSAHSFLGKRRWWNLRTVRGYCQALDAGEPPVEGEELLTPEQEHLEKLGLAWRTAAGIPRHELADNPATEAALARLVSRGCVRRVGNRYVPTLEGYLLADQIPLLFL